MGPEQLEEGEPKATVSLGLPGAYVPCPPPKPSQGLGPHRLGHPGTTVTTAASCWGGGPPTAVLPTADIVTSSPGRPPDARLPGRPLGASRQPRPCQALLAFDLGLFLRTRGIPGTPHRVTARRIAVGGQDRGHLGHLDATASRVPTWPLRSHTEAGPGGGQKLPSQTEIQSQNNCSSIFIYILGTCFPWKCR